MKYEDYYNEGYYKIKRSYNVNDEIWACAFEYNSFKEGKLHYQKPVLGKFMAGQNETCHNMAMHRGNARAKFFVPYKKNKVDLAWSKAVNIESRIYASTEEECIELFNSLIQKYIEWHEKEINKLKNELIK